MNKINETFKQYMELEKANNQIERDLEVQGEEFEAITKEMDQATVAVFLGHLLDEPRYEKAKKYVGKTVPRSVGLLIGFNILINAVFAATAFNPISILIGLAIYLGLSFTQIRDDLEIIKKYKEVDERLNSYNSGIINRLREIKELIKSLDAQRHSNADQMKALEGKIVDLLALEMQEAYRKQGIEEEIEIDQATITANTKNRLELTYNKGGSHE